MNIIFLGDPAVQLSLPNVIHVVDEYDFRRMLKLDPEAFGIFMCSDRHEGPAIAKNVRVDGIENHLYCLMHGPEADAQMIATVLSAGADQVEHHPVDDRLFVAQVAAVRRRDRDNLPATLRFGDISFDPQTGNMTSPRGKAYLTAQEGRFLSILLASPGRTISRDHAHELMFANDPGAPTKKLLDVLLCKVRKKIGSLTEIDYFESVWGKGFRFVPEGFKPQMTLHRANGQFLPRATVREAAE